MGSGRCDSRPDVVENIGEYITPSALSGDEAEYDVLERPENAEDADAVEAKLCR